MQALFYSCDTPCKYTIACFTTVPLNHLSVEAIVVFLGLNSFMSSCCGKKCTNHFRTKPKIENIQVLKL